MVTKLDEVELELEALTVFTVGRKDISPEDAGRN